MPKSSQRPGGFTLVELLIAALLAALLAGSLLAAFSGGLRVWQRAREWDESAVQALLALEEIERDVRNTIAARAGRFEGDERRLSIPSVVSVAGPNGLEEWPGVTRYEVDGGARTVVRRTVARGRSGRQTAVAVASSVDRAGFAFLARSGDRSGEGWISSWSGRTNLPAAVRVSLTIRSTPEPLSLERTIALPLAR